MPAVAPRLSTSRPWPVPWASPQPFDPALRSPFDRIAQAHYALRNVRSTSVVIAFADQLGLWYIGRGLTRGIGPAVSHSWDVVA